MKFKLSFFVAILSLVIIMPLSADDTAAAANSPKAELPDIVHLRTGRELRGKILSEKKDSTDGRNYVVIRTDSGGLVKLDTARFVQKIQYADSVDLEYQKRLKSAGDDPNLYWKLYDWCKEQPSGNYRFKDELQFILRTIARLDANDERSRRLLDYDLVDGRWLYKPALFAAHGYQKNGTSWAPELQSAVDQKTNDRNQVAVERKRQLSQWLRNVNSSNASAAELTQQLFSFCDDVAVPIILDQQAKKEKNPRMRLVYVEAFGRVASFEANRALCYFAIDDPAQEVRERALTLLGQPHFDHEVSARLMSGYLGAGDIGALKRAAFAIGELGAKNAVIPMIDALQTKQVVAAPGLESGRMAMSFGGNGGSGLQTGGAPEMREEVLTNGEVRTALKKITDQDFGFDKAAWKRWYLKNYTLYDIRVRADD